MKPLSADELRMNHDAASVAAGVLSETVVAATRCEQVTMDMRAGAAGVGAVNRGLMRGMKSMNRAMMPGVGGMAKGLETGGLPGSFVLAVTDTQIHALEDKQNDGSLVAGKVLKSWDRDGFVAKRGPAAMNASSGVPDDRQVLILFLPIEGGNNRYLKAAARNTAAAGSAGMPRKVMVAKDEPSEGVIDAIASAGGPNIQIGGNALQAMMGQAAASAPAAVDPMDRLGKLAELRDRGVLTDDEFAAQKAKILSEM
jgi:hypothetical protein